MKLKKLTVLLLSLCLLTSCGSTEKSSSKSDKSDKDSSFDAEFDDEDNGDSDDKDDQADNEDEDKTTTSKKTTQKKTEAVEKPTECSHDWQEADCKNPKTCKKCGVTSGSAASHKWKEATCTEPKTCTVCGTTSGIPDMHSWEYATCTTPKTCKKCGTTEGEPKGHSWKDATYDAPKTCRTCGATEGSKLDASSMWSLTVNTPLPAKFNYYDTKNNIRDTVEITQVRYEFEPKTYDTTANLKIYFSGKKTYDVKGSGQSRTSKVSLKLYDANGNVKDSKTFYSPSLSMGETFVDEDCVFYSVKPGNYRLELIHTN